MTELDSSPRIRECEPICIAGMHRSGTSLVARLLHLAGIYLGPESDMMLPGPDNPDGYWENLRFTNLNDEILNELGGGWDCPPLFPDRLNNQDEGLEYLKVKAERIGETFLGHGPWGWKDPRNCLTLPFWARRFPNLRVIVCVRNPLEVARSLSQRNQTTFALGLTLWQIYNLCVLEWAPRERRLITNYEKYYYDPASELQRIFNFLGLPISEQALAQACAAVSVDLRHQRFTMRHLLEAQVAPEVLNLYSQMCAESGWSEDGLANPGQSAGSTCSAAGDPERRSSKGEEWREVKRDTIDPEPVAMNTRLLGGTVGRLDKAFVEAELLGRETQTLRNALETRNATIRDLERQLVDRATRIAEQEQTLQALSTQISQKEQALAALNYTIGEQSAHLDALALRLEFVSTRDSELRTLLLDAHAQLVDRDNEIQRLRQEGIPLSQGIEALGKRLEYRQLIGRIRKVAADTLPPKAKVAVVSKGDDQLLSLNGCEGWHFPQSADGVYSGYYPADSESAISELETLRSKGAEYLLFPSTCFWWLEHYAGFKRHLDRRYKMIARNQDVCIIYSLAKRTPKRASGGTARRAPAQTRMKAKR